MPARGPLPHKATHLTLRFDETIAYYSDIRQFGWWRLMPTDAVDAALGTFRFGPEGTGSDDFARDDLAARLQRRRIAVKQALLDQRVVAGLGNIYVDEALHRANSSAQTGEQPQPGGGHPAARGDRWALDRGIEQGGAAIRRGGLPARWVPDRACAAR